MAPKRIIIIILGILFLTILLQNTQVVTLNLLFWQIGMSRIIFIPLVLLIGIIIGFILGSMRKKQNKKSL
ncbi:MAG: DUF1049 domain-containing protein [Caldithrix sp.]|nr:DUF1049 domain-containing protein [Caldithrix sp.]